jgi:hypothetical protein
MAWGPPADVPGAIAVLRDAIASDVDHIDTSENDGVCSPSGSLLFFLLHNSIATGMCCHDRLLIVTPSVCFQNSTIHSSKSSDPNC